MAQRLGFFRAMEKLENTYNAARYGSQPRPLQDEDFDDWTLAGEASMPSMRTRADVQRRLRQINPVKWRQINGDINWMKKHMKKLGLNPEDYRYILP